MNSLKVETCKALPTENCSRIKHCVSSSGSESKVTLFSFYERWILKEYTQRSFALFTLLPSGSGRMESAQPLLSLRLGHRSAHPTHFILRTLYIRPDDAECSISAELGPKSNASHRAEFCWQGKSRKTPLLIQFSSDRISHCLST